MSANYLTDGAGVTAANWNNLFEAADAALYKILDGASAQMAYLLETNDQLAPCFLRRFFFFDPNSPPSTLHVNAAIGFDSNYFNGSSNPAAPAFNFQYNHAAFLSAIAALPLFNTSAYALTGIAIASAGSGYQVGDTLPFVGGTALFTQTVVVTGVNGSGGITGFSNGTYGSYSAAPTSPAATSGGHGTGATFSFTADNTVSPKFGVCAVAVNTSTPLPYYNLDACLSVIKRTVNGVSYVVTLAQNGPFYSIPNHFVLDANCARPWTPIDVFINGNLTWDSTWDKYSLVRIQNCAASAVTCTFGSAVFTVGAGSSQCVRKVGGSWQVNGKYFHWMDSGDGRFFNLFYDEWASSRCSVTSPGMVVDTIARLIRSANNADYIAATYGGNLYPDQMWNTALALGVNWFPFNTSSSTMLGDVILNKGQVLVIDPTSLTTCTVANTKVINHDTVGNLAAHLAAAGLATRSLVVGTGTDTTLEIYSPGNTKHLADLSTPLSTAISAGANPVLAVGSSQSSSPPSLALPTVTLTVQAPDFEEVAYSGYSSLQVVSNVPVTKQFAWTNTLGDVAAWLSANCGNGITCVNARIYQTTFGPMLCWDELWPINAAFGSGIAIGGTQSGIIRVLAGGDYISVGGGPLAQITRGFYIAVNLGVFPVFGSGYSLPSTLTFLSWNWPRTERRFGFNRFFYNDPNDAPWIPAYSDTLHTHYSLGLTGLEAGYESEPISIDTVVPVSTLPKPNYKLMGANTVTSDFWGIFSYWWAGLSTFTFSEPPGVSASIPIADATYYNNQTNFLTNAVLTDFVTLGPYLPAPNALPCEIEQFNSLASVVNALPFLLNGPPYYYSPPLGSFTLTYGASNIIIVSGGNGYAVGDQLEYGLQVSAISANSTRPVGTGSVPTGAITAVSQVGAVYVDTFTFDAPAARPLDIGNGAALSPLNDHGTGNGLTVDSNTGAVVGNPYFPAPNIANNFSGAGSFTAFGSYDLNYFPRGGYYGWTGNVASGGADPIKTYLSSIGFPIKSDTTGLADNGVHWIMVADFVAYMATLNIAFSWFQATLSYSITSNGSGGVNAVQDNNGIWCEPSAASALIKNESFNFTTYGNPDWLVAIIPKNTATFPNVEASFAQVIIVGGNTGENVVECTLDNAQIQILPVDS